MPLFECSHCGNLDNTALGHYWGAIDAPMCTRCFTGKWHGKFDEQKDRRPLVLAHVQPIVIEEADTTC
jgi:hypothetical protein